MHSRTTHLGLFTDLIDTVASSQPLFPHAPPGLATQRIVREVLAFASPDAAPLDAQVVKRWEVDGIVGEVVSWSAGFGPPTEAWLLKPADADQPLPGILALHGHDGFKYFGKEKIADGPNGPEPALHQLRAELYEGRAFANELARRGFVVLVPDVFLWGSRRFPLDVMPVHIRSRADVERGTEVERYNVAARFHEDVVAKYSAVLGTTIAGIVSAEDRIAARYLLDRPDTVDNGFGCVGLSGGGARSALLQATSPVVRAAVIVGMMSTYAALLDHHIASHTWMFFPHGWSRYGDWPDLAACRAPSPLLVQYLEDDHLFSPNGMRDADKRISAHYANAGAPDMYQGQFFAGSHRFDREMQDIAFDWLASHLK